MKKILVSTIFSLTIFGAATASIISRGFFDEQIGKYATLDLLNSKANQSDITNLSNKIGSLSYGIIDDSDFITSGADDIIVNSNLIYNRLYEFDFNSVTDGFAYFINTYLFDIWYALHNGYDLYRNDNPVMGLPALTNAVNKIGAVPDGYTNLADALAAVKITADTAKQLAEQAIPNVLNESSNGKYVLTAEKVGDTATYKWEIIDRTLTESQSQSE